MEQGNYARLETRYGKPAMLEGVYATGDLRGPLLEMSVEQRFRNASPTNIEVVYSFPLPWGAVLLGVEVVLGDQRLTGAVVAKRQAEAHYEEALSEGKAAIMLEKNADLSYTLSLGNLAAGEACAVTLRYAQVLAFGQDGLRLSIPTVIAPRYGDAVIDGGLQPHQAPTLDPLVAYPFDIRLRLHGDLAQARVASPSHPIGVGREGSPGAEVLSVALARRGNLDRDFVLTLDLVQDSLAVCAQDPVDATRVVALASLRPRLGAEAVPGMALKILVDCSGSMAGDSMEAAKRALQAITHQFLVGDRFAVSRFGSSVEHRSRGLWSLTEATRRAAQRWVAGLEADLGGTEMEAALVSTCALAHDGACDLLLVTDGEIYAIERALTAARDSGHRVFVVGIGASPAEGHLRRLAEASGGACDFVAPGEAVEPAVRRMFARLRSPRRDDLTLAWPAGADPQWVSPLGSALFDGDTVTAFAWLRAQPHGTVQLRGTAPTGGTPEVIASAAVHLEPAGGETLARVAAAVRLQSLGAEEAEAVALAVAYQLVTDRTNFLLVHARAEGEAPTELPELHKVAQMLPAGWGGLGSVLAAGCPSPADSSADTGWGVADGDLSFSLAEPSADLPSPDRPAVYRRLHAARASASSPEPDRDYLDIPAFLRRQVAPPPPMPSTRGPAAGDNRGLTPFGLSEWLRRTPQTQWPRTYAGLRRIGLGSAVLDWLELVIGIDATGPLC
jgi:Ca-activated chloride channel family protein